MLASIAPLVNCKTWYEPGPVCRYCCGTDCYGAQRETTAHALQESLVAYRCPWHAAVQQWILVPCLSKAKLPQQQTTAVASVRAENMMRVASGELHWFRSPLSWVTACRHLRAGVYTRTWCGATNQGCCKSVLQERTKCIMWYQQPP